MSNHQMDVLVLADTHIRRGSSRTLPPRVRLLAQHADVILHAGDIVVAEVLDELAAHAPTHAVLGNNDHELIGALPPIHPASIGGIAPLPLSPPNPGRISATEARGSGRP